MAPLQGLPCGDAGRRALLQAQDGRVLGGLAHARPDGELRRVLHVDGTWFARDLVVLICCGGERAVSWYMARSENSRAWSALMSPIPAPEVVVTDGGSGFAKAVRETWPRARVQRCTFHAFSQVERYTTTRPKLQAGRELYLIARDLMGIETLHQAELWVVEGGRVPDDATVDVLARRIAGERGQRTW